MAGIPPLGMAPLRRTVAQLRMGRPVPADLPLTLGFDGSFYFKPEGGRLWLSPHDETPSPPCDAAPEELDVALAIDRFEHVVDWPIATLEHKWAGLRTFSPDRLPVYGFDPAARDFFWFAGQGGFGIQTAPAAADLALALLDRPAGAVDPAPYSIRPFPLANRWNKSRLGGSSWEETVMAHKFEIYKDKAGEFRVRFKYNSEVMFSTEGYASKASAENAIASIKKNGPDAPIEDNS
jgi:uncharacterized protein YegP (UPF0339 family)